MKTKNLHLRIPALILLTAILFTSCKKDSPVKPKENHLSSFNILKSDGTAFDKNDISISVATDSISVTVPIFTDVTNLIPDLKVDAGASVSPANGVKNNFIEPVTYSVTASDGTVKKYKVIVHHDKLKNVVYVGGHDKNLYALNANTGALIWKYTAQGGMEYSSPVLVNGILYIGSVDHNMYALDPVTGALKWKFATQSSIMSVPAIVNGIVYFGSDDSYVYAVDALTGTLKWKYKTGFNADTDPLVKNGVVYMGSGDGKLYALNALSGNLKWSFDTGNLLIDWRILESNGAVLIGGRSGVLYALNENDGSVKWSASVGGGNTLERSKVVINNGVIYITDGAYGSLRAIKESDGSPIWKSLDNLGFWSGPTLANGFLYVSSNDNNFYIINAATGAVIIKKMLITNGSLATIADGKIFVAAGGEHFFYALDAVTATPVWKFPLPESILNSQALVVDKNGDW
ncbi:PQQ-binding-like beta-propeller repeat protein [Mucilaginibacter sp. Mucisp86]|uniref:outer membrane protein assembly factor BamB family protein n=1 Tax=Mucilaginibacter sp. Mucisp86 TaxID=3243060 RepID=UPI0039B4B38B